MTKEDEEQLAYIQNWNKQQARKKKNKELKRLNRCYHLNIKNKQGDKNGY